MNKEAFRVPNLSRLPGYGYLGYVYLSDMLAWVYWADRYIYNGFFIAK